jgi:sarcosine oxidase
MAVSSQSFDCIVLGTGGVGSAALYHLARRGMRVLGVDRFAPGHDRGSSHGQTRVIRLAYFEHTDYVPLLRRAFELWHELEAQCDEQLYVRTGIIEVGPPDGEVLPGVLRAAHQHDLAVDTLTAAEVQKQYPGLRLPEHWQGVFETEAGYLWVEKCVIAHAAAARACGAQLHSGEEVLTWSVAGDGVVVQTDRQVYRADRLVLTAGAWAPRLLQDLKVSLQVLRKPLLWYRTTQPDYRREGGFPVWFFETPDGIFYGFPELDEMGLKAAEHTGGQAIDDPLRLERQLTPEDRRPLEAFLRRHMPGVSDRCVQHTVCMYTTTPDGHFIVDRHPEQAPVCFAAGLSGHGFKLSNLLGEVLADLALTGSTRHPIDFLSVGRFL